MRVAVLDLGLGNLLSIKRALERQGAEVSIIPECREGADLPPAIVLPGVGAFRDGISAMGKFKGAIEAAKGGRATVLGICLGMQLLLSKSYEGGEYEGLNLIRGEVIKLPQSVKVPHMGWNSIRILKGSPITEGVADGEFFYFVHSYHCSLQEDVAIAETEYGTKVVAMVEKRNVFGTQFHPEKSGAAGARIIRNFLEVSKR